jgi:Concanavalin A-like lectin/glucanases superfamily
MRSGAPRLSKPPAGTQPDWGNPLLPVYCMPLNEQAGAPNDVITQRLPTTLAGSPTWVQTTDPGGAMYFNASAAGAYATLPAWLKLAYPFTMAVRAAVNASAAAGANLFAIDINGGTVPMGLRIGGSNDLRVSYGNGASSAVWSTTYALPTTPVTLVVVLTSTGQTLYVAGVQNSTNSATPSNPTYGGTSYIGIGANPSTTTNPTAKISWAMMWNRALSAGEAASISSNPWQIFADPLPASYWASARLGGSTYWRGNVLRPLDRPLSAAVVGGYYN